MTIQPERTSGETYLFAGGVLSILVDGADTAGEYCALMVRSPPGNAEPPHLHETDTETLVLLSGAITVEAGGRTRVYYPGDVAVLPPGHAHRFVNTGAGEASYLLLCAPAGFEHLVRRAGVEVAASEATPRPMDEGDARRLAAEAPKFGVRLLDGLALTQAAPNLAPTPTEDDAHALGSTISVLARYGDRPDAPVLLRITPPPRTVGPFTSPAFAARGVTFHARARAAGSRQIALASAVQPTIVAVTTAASLQRLRAGDLPLDTGNGQKPMQRMLAVLHAIDANGGGQRHVIVDGSPMNIVDVGTGPAVLLAGSYLFDAAMWAPQVAALADRYRVIVPELWGHGGSGPMPRDTSDMADLARQHRALLDRLGVERCAVVGLSIGGMWGAELALMAPDRVAAV